MKLKIVNLGNKKNNKQKFAHRRDTFSIRLTKLDTRYNNNFDSI